jgi:hypothetical protein
MNNHSIVRNDDDETWNNVTKGDVYSSTSQLSLLSDEKSTETSKTELIQRILESLKTTPPVEICSTSQSNVSMDEPTDRCPSAAISNKIYVHFANENELGLRPDVDDLLDRLSSTKTCSCHRMNIDLQSSLLNQQLSYKQKQSILRIVLRRQQIVQRYFTSSI